MRVLVLAMVIAIISSCSATTADTTYLEKRVVILEQKIDAMQYQLDAIAALTIDKKSSAKKSTGRSNKSKTNTTSNDYVVKPPTKQPTESDKLSHVLPVTESKNTTASSTRSSRTYSSSSPTQCGGITKKGSRCKRMVRSGGNCWQH